MFKYKIHVGKKVYRRKYLDSDKPPASSSERAWEGIETTKECVFSESDIADSEAAFPFHHQTDWFQFLLPPEAHPWKIIAIEKHHVEIYHHERADEH